MDIKYQKVDTLIIYENQLYKKLSSIRQEILKINQFISMPNSPFELRGECTNLREEFAKLNQDLVLVENQIKKYKKEKSTVRQESTLKKTTNH